MSLKKKIAIGICVILLIFLLSIGLYFTFSIKTITVSYEYLNESEKLTSQEINKISQDSGFKKGDIIFTVSKNKATGNIERQNSSVKVLQIIKSFPGKVTIVIQKKTPIYAFGIKNDNENMALLDEDLHLTSKISKNKINKDDYIIVKNSDLDLDDLIKYQNNKDKYITENSRELETLNYIQEEFNFNDKKSYIENTKRFKTFIKGLSYNKKTRVLTLNTVYGISIEYNTHHSDIKEQVHTSFLAIKQLLADKPEIIYGIVNNDITGLKIAQYKLINNNKEWNIK